MNPERVIIENVRGNKRMKNLELSMNEKQCHGCRFFQFKTDGWHECVQGEIIRPVYGLSDGRIPACEKFESESKVRFTIEKMTECYNRIGDKSISLEKYIEQARLIGMMGE